MKIAKGCDLFETNITKTKYMLDYFIMNLNCQIAELYLTDARDYLERFDFLWEEIYSKSKQIKCFIDLLMACECALKAHIFLCSQKEQPENNYNRIRRISHNISKLADESKLLKQRDLYERVKCNLSPFSVTLRYKLDSDATFFPPLVERDKAKINYSKTLANYCWVMSVRDDIEFLIECAMSEDIVCSDRFEVLLGRMPNLENFIKNTVSKV